MKQKKRVKKKPYSLFPDPGLLHTHKCIYMQTLSFTWQSLLLEQSIQKGSFHSRQCEMK